MEQYDRDLDDLDKQVQKVKKLRTEAALRQLIPLAEEQEKMNAVILDLQNKKNNVICKFRALFRRAFSVVYEVRIDLEDSDYEDVVEYFIDEKTARKYCQEQKDSHAGWSRPPMISCIPMNIPPKPTARSNYIIDQFISPKLLKKFE